MSRFQNDDEMHRNDIRNQPDRRRPVSSPKPTPALTLEDLAREAALLISEIGTVLDCRKKAQAYEAICTLLSAAQEAVREERRRAAGMVRSWSKRGYVPGGCESLAKLANSIERGGEESADDK